MTKTLNGRIQKIGIGAAEFEILELNVTRAFRQPGFLNRDTLVIISDYGTEQFNRARYSGSPRDIDALVRGISGSINVETA